MMDDFNSLDIVNTHIQAVSTRASLESITGRDQTWGSADWRIGKSIEREVEPDRVLDHSLQLPFDPTNRDRHDIREALEEISSFQAPEQERIFRHAKEFYTEEVDDIDAVDALNIAEIYLFAEDNDHSDWIKTLSGRLDEYFEGIEENPMYLHQESSDTELTWEEAREAFISRGDRMRRATEEVFGSSSEGSDQSFIEEAQKVYLWRLLKELDEFTNLTP